MTFSSVSTPSNRAKPRAWLPHLAALAFYSLLTVLMTWPLVLHMGSAVVGEIGDNIYFVFLIRWYQKAVFELGISPFFHPWLNYPQGWNLASTDTSLATTGFGLPISALFGPTAGYNFAMLVTFVLSGWAMFVWVRRLTHSTAAGLLAGTIYAFFPYRMAHFLIGHMNLSGTAWFPLYFLGLYDLLRAPTVGAWRKSRATLTALGIAALAFGLIAFTSMYYLYMTLLMSGVFVLGYIWFAASDQWHSLAFWRGLAQKLAVLGIASLPLAGLAVWPFLGLDSQGGLATRSVSYASMYSASPTDYLLPSTQHFLVGAWVGAHFDRSLWIEASFYLGIVTVTLAVLAWVRRRASQHGALLKIALLIVVTAFILSLGTDLHWNNQRVEVPVPAALQGMLHRETTPIPLPAYILFRYLPFYAKMRAIMRMGLFVLIFTCLMAGLGAGWLFQKVGARRAVPLAAVLIALIFLEFYPGPYRQFATVAARPVDAWLARQPEQGALAQFPFAEEEDQDQVYNTLVHGKPFIGGFFSANQPEQYVRIRPVLAQFPSMAGVDLLRTLGVYWVVFDTRQYTDFSAVRRQVETLGLRYVDTISGEAVFTLPPEPVGNVRP